MRTSPPVSFWLEQSFSGEAKALRAELVNLLSLPGNPGLRPTSLTYDYAPNLYQCLTIPAVCVFSRETLAAFVEALSVWSRHTLSASHVSTPNLHIYIHGCMRRLVRDETDAKWHYLLHLTPDSRRHRTVVKILDNLESSPGAIRTGRISKIGIRFNELLTHEVEKPYAIEVNTSMNPLEGAAFLSGYFW